MCSQEEIIKLKNKIKEVDIVSFDIFDTLLLRNVVAPTDIFEVVEQKYYNETKRKIDFKKGRILAEEKARDISINEEVTYEEIYYQFENMYPGLSRQFKEIELETEENFLVCNTKMLEVYQWALHQGKKVLIISDMYLSQEVIEKFLSCRGYTGDHKTYISSQVMMSKASGTLYRYIREKEAIAQEEKWLHIGDNYISDYLSAEKLGIIAYYYKPVRERYEKYKCATISESIIRAMQINEMYLEDTDRDYWYNFGIDKVGPLYIGFMQWLEKELEGKDNVYFLARDGYMPYQLYNLLCQRNEKLPKGRYIYASRRAYIYPGLPDIPREEALDLLMATNQDLNQCINVAEILENIGLESQAYEERLKKCSGLSLDELLKTDAQVHNARIFLNGIWKDIEVVLRDEKKTLIKYFEQEELDKYQEINIVDIGWRGSTHKALQSILQKKVNGYYVGTIKEIYEEIKSSSKGYLFDRGLPKRNKKLVMENVMIFELLFSAPNGSLIKFLSRDEKVYPYLKEVEKDANLYMKIQKLQQGVFTSFNMYLNYRKIIQPISRNSCIYSLERFIDKKNINDLKEFAKISNSVGMGESRDIKDYVYIIRSDRYIAQVKKTAILGQSLLWKNAILIEDNQGRYFNLYEFNRLYKIKTIREYKRFRIYILRIKKAIKNPEKAIKFVIKKFLKPVKEYTS